MVTETKEDAEGLNELNSLVSDPRIEVIKQGKVGQEQLYNLLLSRELSWQDIIYDLINTEQLDPWDIDLTLLAAKYLEKLKQIEEANFFISSKVLLASSILLRIKSEILLNRYIRSLDEILFGKKEQKAKPFERIDFDEDLPELIPKTPLPRLKKVSLPELMQALERAMVTEHRRIRRGILEGQAKRNIGIVLPKFSFNLKEKIKEIYGTIKNFFKHQKDEKLTFSYLTGNGGRAEKISTFVPLLHLDHQLHINLEQPEHFGEIYVYLKDKKEQTAQTIENAAEELKEFSQDEMGKAENFDMIEETKPVNEALLKELDEEIKEDKPNI